MYYLSKFDLDWHVSFTHLKIYKLKYTMLEPPLRNKVANVSVAKTLRFATYEKATFIEKGS